MESKAIKGNLKWIIVLMGGIFLVGYLLALLKIPLQVIDDSFITFTYAKNFAFHGKPWYNLDPFFQGCGQTSLLWMCLIALGNLFSIKALTFFPIFNALLSIILINDFTKTLLNQKSINFQNVFLWVLYPFLILGLYLHSTHGLETILEIFFLYYFFKNWNSKSSNYWAIFLILIRPELVLLSGAWALSAFKTKSIFWKRAIVVSLGVFAFALFYFAFYDFYIPLSALYKFRENFSLEMFKVLIGNALLFLPIGYLFFINKEYFLLTVMTFLVYYYTAHVGGYSNVYLRYIFPLLVIYFAFPFQWNKLKFSRFKSWKWVTALFILIFLFRLIDIGFNFEKNYQNLVGENDTFKTTYKSIAEESEATDKFLVTDAGMIAYYNKGMCYDGLGLNDATLLLAKKEQNWDAYFNYVESRKINKILISSFIGDSLEPRFEHEKKLVSKYHLNQEPFQKKKGRNFDLYQFEVDFN